MSFSLARPFRNPPRKSGDVKRSASSSGPGLPRGPRGKPPRGKPPRAQAGDMGFTPGQAVFATRYTNGNFVAFFNHFVVFNSTSKRCQQCLCLHNITIVKANKKNFNFFKKSLKKYFTKIKLCIIIMIINITYPKTKEKARCFKDIQNSVK